MQTIVTLYKNAFPNSKLFFKGRGEYGETASACPNCGGEDRFILLPEEGTCGRYFCRQCGITGDGIDFCMTFLGMDFKQACEHLGLEHKLTQRSKNITAKPSFARKSQLAAPVKKPPLKETSLQWSNTALAFVQRAMDVLNTSKSGQDILVERCLTMETARALKMGYNPHDQYLDYKEWGLEPEINPKTGKLKKVWIPKGFVLPMGHNKQILSILVRRDEWTQADKLPKYIHVKGGQQCCYCLGKSGKPVVIVESLLDAALIWQEARELVCAIALNGATKEPDPYALELIQAAPFIFTAFDADNAGDNATNRWRASFKGAFDLIVAEGKDPCEQHKLGIPVKEWIEWGISKALEERQKKASPSQPENIEPELEQELAVPVTAPQVQTAQSSIFDIGGQATDKEECKSQLAAQDTSTNAYVLPWPEYKRTRAFMWQWHLCEMFEKRRGIRAITWEQFVAYYNQKLMAQWKIQIEKGLVDWYEKPLLLDTEKDQAPYLFEPMCKLCEREAFPCLSKQAVQIPLRPVIEYGCNHSWLREVKTLFDLLDSIHRQGLIDLIADPDPYQWNADTISVWSYPCSKCPAYTKGKGEGGLFRCGLDGKTKESEAVCCFNPPKLNIGALGDAIRGKQEQAR